MKERKIGFLKQSVLCVLRAVLTEAALLAQIDLLNENEEDPAELSRPTSLRYKHTPF